ncbi:MAG: type VII secretion protein EssC [Culicoidibacterales bacterium]
MKKLLIFDEISYKEYDLIDSFSFDGGTFLEKEGRIEFHSELQEVQTIELARKIKLGAYSCIVFGEKEYIYIKPNKPLIFGQNNCDIVIKTGTYIIEQQKIINDSAKRCYINGLLTEEKTCDFEYGDHLLIDDLLIVIQEKSLKIIGGKLSWQTELLEYVPPENENAQFPDYYKSPRIIRKLKTGKFTIQKPPQKITRKKGGLVKIIIPPVVMAIGTVVMAVMTGRGMYMLIGLAGTAVSLIFSITVYLEEQKELNTKTKKRTEVYEQYLLNTRKILNKYKQDEAEALQYNHPTLEMIHNLINTYSPRIYERDFQADDFLVVTVGRLIGESNYRVHLEYDHLSPEEDELLDEAKAIYDEYKKNIRKPVVIDLKKAHLGIVGEKKEIHEQIHWILAELTFFHSYHDLQLVMLYSSEYKMEFDYIKWYPHAKLQANNLTGNVHSERIREQVFASLYQILKERKNKREEMKQEMHFSPHYIIIVDEYHMIMNHAIIEYFQNNQDLGFSLIYTAPKQAHLPENIKTVIVMEDMDQARLVLNEGEEVNAVLQMQRIGNVNLEKAAREISVLNHIQGINSTIPEVVTFLDMYQVKTVEDLQVANRWRNGESHKSLAVPIGFRAEGDFVELNLHEKAHGPHGLVAGTTGSGKSETIQTYILSLAVNFSPHEVGFLLIDYKGGGMAHLFKGLPHLLGTITNLDGSESMRALESIKAELSRRQVVFSKNGVNNINNYNKLFKAGKAEEALPHLFIISDEFAELKKEQPEFMSELVSVARIGRTLGVHLILATQKPTGVVDDQIWSNSKFKLALKVQDESDSKEIIKTPDAAFITQTGRGYLQVGNNEIYELFQTAWSGAMYSVVEKKEVVDDRIYKINLLGQGELINQDLSTKGEQYDLQTTQLDAVVAHIHEYYESLNWSEVAKPWLQSLERNISRPTQIIGDTAKVNIIDTKVAIGIIDIPEQQKQEEYGIDLIKDGNLAIFSSSGFGKTTTLGTILLTLAEKNNPKLLSFYIIDFGNSSLIPYKALPHVAEYMTFDSEEKLNKFQRIMTEEIKQRKQLFAKEMLQNFDMYNQIHLESPLNAIVIVIDNFDVVKEFSMAFEEFITKLTRDGNGLGIYTIITATRSNALRFSTVNNFKNKIVHYLFDSGDVLNLVGRSKYQLSDEIKGRAVIKQKDVNLMQVYAPVKFTDDIEFITNLKENINKISIEYTGPEIVGIPTLPDVFTTNDFGKYKREACEGYAIGLNLETVEVISLNISSGIYIIIGQAKTGKTNFIEILLKQLEGKTYIFDSEAMNLYKYKQQFNYIYTDIEIEQWINEMNELVQARKQLLEARMTGDMLVNPKEFYTDLEKINLVIDDADYFVTKVQKQAGITQLLEQLCHVGIKIIVGANSAKMKGYDDVTKLFKTATNGAVLGQVGSLTIFPLHQRDIPTFGYGLVYENGKAKKVKLPKVI